MSASCTLSNILLFVSILTYLSGTAHADVTNHQVSNLTSSSATVSWTSSGDVDGCVRYGLSTALGDSVEDLTVDNVHFTEITGLDAETQYYFEIRSGDVVDDNGGAYYTFTTSPVGVGVPFTTYGDIYLPDSVTPAERAIVTLSLHKDGSVVTHPLSALTDVSGFWFTNLGDLKDIVTGAAYSYSDADTMIISYMVGSCCGDIDTVLIEAESPQDCGEATIYNTSPMCLLPADTTIFLCELGEVSVPVVSDSEDNVTEIVQLSGPGSVEDLYWAYTATGEETIGVSFGCTDGCGAYTECSSTIHFEINASPECAIPNDTLIVLETLDEILLPVSGSDVDNNLVGCSVLVGPGSISDGFWHYVPTGPELLIVTVVCWDECNDSCGGNFAVTLSAPYDCGDANGSGAVDIDDVVFLIQYIFAGGPAPDPLASGDANCAGGIDIDDVVYLIQYIFAGGNPPCDTNGDEVPDC